MIYSAELAALPVTAVLVRVAPGGQQAVLEQAFSALLRCHAAEGQGEGAGGALAVAMAGWGREGSEAGSEGAQGKPAPRRKAAATAGGEASRRGKGKGKKAGGARKRAGPRKKAAAAPRKKALSAASKPNPRLQGAAKTAPAAAQGKGGGPAAKRGPKKLEPEWAGDTYTEEETK